ncbi:hypothetical protein CAPTEDRAFT_218690 [Capitella teleta]|uniref:UPAR/Ly6 domain-containing protein n=1 Tax=Capitella teleta TaxID=283909 RepID=R7VM38_CAPTE|nr:hypothetical protein CAPTEDRAFT_218690 [Capitella teleta]|eukprot:ELU18165.1 hypothetical protein CAPTEDRAFT_218690 [Capitella teleta]
MQVVYSDAWLFIASFFSLFYLGSGIKCLQCTSLLNSKCIGGDLPALDCSRESRFCIKYVGIILSDVVVFRECNLNQIAHNCTIKILEGQRIHVCYETCDTDACNGGSALPQSLPYNSTSHFSNQATSIERFQLLTALLPSLITLLGCGCGSHDKSKYCVCASELEIGSDSNACGDLD